MFKSGFVSVLEIINAIKIITTIVIVTTKAHTLIKLFLSSYTLHAQ